MRYWMNFSSRATANLVKLASAASGSNVLKYKTKFLKGDWAHEASREILSQNFKRQMLPLAMGGTLRIEEVLYKALSEYVTHSKLERFPNVDPKDVKSVLMMEQLFALALAVPA